jgi:hypothetical protein
MALADCNRQFANNPKASQLFEHTTMSIRYRKATKEAQNALAQSPNFSIKPAEAQKCMKNECLPTLFGN